MSDHPSKAELLEFAAGELTDDRFEEVAEHLDSCDQCADVLRQTGASPKLRGEAFTAQFVSGMALAAGESPTTHHPMTEGPGSTIGPYKLLQKLGEGGMGVVYMAEQEKPVQRKVALKIIKPGMDSGQVIARFEAERQALAMMDHHHIAKVLDAGTTDTGRPYFAMELVKGVPITDYCDKNQLTTRERLEMFIPVCQAIQHAHHKGIIHRDIKPTNVLVTLYDGKPVPKVIDFGIAKATQQKLTERTMFTGLGQILGTLEYMSPEQAEMNQLDIDTRSDVYSLGVMLYELLTGSTPITKEKLRNVGFEEMLRTIRETEPPKPSTRLSDSAEALPSISAIRKTEPAKLSKLIRGDLDWIVMKALEKDRTRRYETANGFAMPTCSGFSADEAVSASPPSASYKFRKFARRNKTAIFTGGTIATLLLVSTIVSSGLAVWALRAEKKASQNATTAQTALVAEGTARKEEEKQRKLADENAAKAVREASKSREVATFLKDMLKGVGPSVALGRDTTMLKEILETTADRLAAELKDQPETEAEIRTTLGNVFKELSEYDKATEQHNQALAIRTALFGGESEQVAESLVGLAQISSSKSEYEEALKLHRRALNIRKKCHVGDHADVAESMSYVAIGLAQLYRWKGQPDADYKSKQEQSLTLGRDAVEMAKRVHGDASREVADGLNILAICINQIDLDHQKTLSIYLEALRIREATSHADDPDLAVVRANTAWLLMTNGQFQRSIKLQRLALDIHLRTLGKSHPQSMDIRFMLLHILEAAGEYDEWEQQYHDALELDINDRQKAELQVSRAMFLQRFGRLTEVKEAFRRATRMTIETGEKSGNYPPLPYESHVDFLTKRALAPLISGDLFKAVETIAAAKTILGLRASFLVHKILDAQTPFGLDDHIDSAIDNRDWESATQMLSKAGDDQKSLAFSELVSVANRANALAQFEQRIDNTDTTSAEARIAISAELYLADSNSWLNRSHLGPLYEASLYAWFQLFDEHSSHCAALLSAEDESPSVYPDITPKSYLIHPDGNDERLAHASELAIKASIAARHNPALGPWYDFVAGLAYYRTGEFEQAKGHLERSKQVFHAHRHNGNDIVLAMTHHRLGNPELANSFLSEAKRTMPKMPDSRSIDDASTISTFDHDVIINWILYEEARALIEGKKSIEAVE